MVPWKGARVNDGLFTMRTEWINITLPTRGWLTHIPLVPHICVIKSDHHWFRLWFGAFSAPNHYLNQFNCTLGNNVQWNLIKIHTFSLSKMHWKLPCGKWRLFCHNEAVTKWLPFYNRHIPEHVLLYRMIKTTNFKDKVIALLSYVVNTDQTTYHYLNQGWLTCSLLTCVCVIRDKFMNVPSRWEKTLHCNVVSHWLGANTKWSLCHSVSMSG